VELGKERSFYALEVLAGGESLEVLAGGESLEVLAGGEAC